MANLSAIAVKNFRSIEKSERLELADINVVIGGNNSGKTSLFKALLLGKFGVSTLLCQRQRRIPQIGGVKFPLSVNCCGGSEHRHVTILETGN